MDATRERYRRAYWERQLELIEEMTAPYKHPHAVLLDIGCGYGRNARRFAQGVERYIGLNIDEEELAKLGAKQEIEGGREDSVVEHIRTGIGASTMAGSGGPNALSGPSQSRSPSPFRRGMTCWCRCGTLWLTTLFTRSIEPSAPHALSTARCMR